MKMTAIVGLPGSGKTYLGEKMEEEDSDVVYLDDITIFNGLNDIHTAVNVYGSPHIVFSDVFLCRIKDREAAIKKLKKIAPNYELNWIFFENNPDKCLQNVRYRNKLGDTRKVENLIHELTNLYTIPEGMQVKKIWQSS